MNLHLRAWATPAIIGSFLVMSVTGVLLFFHLEPPLSKGLHEWAGLAMVAGGAAHLWLNRRAFTAYFRRPLARAIMGAGAVVLGLTFLPIGPAAEAQGPGALIAALQPATVTELAAIAHKTPEATLADIAAAGFAAAGPQATVAEIAGGGRGGMQLLIAALAPAAPG